MANGYGSSSTTSARQSRVNTQGQVAPPGFHYMPDGTLMSDAEHARIYGGANKVINSFHLDLSDLPAASTKRTFTIMGVNEPSFSLEIKNEDDYYYNFTTNTFQAAKARLDNKIIEKGKYQGSITFPTVTDNDHYDVYLFAEAGSKHAPYNEVRFGDGSLDINSSTGSNSLLVQKIIYQYTPVTLTLSAYAATSAFTISSLVNDTFELNRGKSSGKIPFTISCSSSSGASLKILRQPLADDILSFFQPVVGSAPELLPGENQYPSVSNTDTTGAIISSTDLVTMTTDVEDKMVPGDRVSGTGISSGDVVTVLNITDGTAKQFRASRSISVGGGVTLSFSNQMNYQWPMDNIDKASPGMIALGSNVTSGTRVGEYRDVVTLFEGTEDEREVVQNLAPALNTKNQKPTIVEGLVTVQPGNIIFNKQQKLALAGDTLKLGGYGTSQILNVFGYEIKFTDLAVALTTITTTTTSASHNSTSVAVAARDGIMNSTSTVSGIGIDPSAVDPTVNSGANATGAGTIVLSAAQTLEDGITLTFGGASRIATITGDIEVLEAGASDVTIRLDLEKILTAT